MSTKDNLKSSLKSENYSALCDYLKENDRRLSLDEFKAVLQCMDILTKTYMTKENCISKVKDKYPSVTKNFMNKILKDMNFMSKTQIEAKKNFGKTRLLDYQYKSKVNREDI